MVAEFGTMKARVTARLHYLRPPRSMKRVDLERGARRLFERAVSRKSWYTMAGDENGPTYPRETGSQRKQVANFARELGIALAAGPPMSARGHLRCVWRNQVGGVVSTRISS